MTRLRRLALLLAAPLAIAAATPGVASAQGYTCEASAFGGRVLTSPREEPAVANAGQPCRTTSAGLVSPPGAPFSGSLLDASTRLEGPAGVPAQQTAVASGGVGQLHVGAVPIPLQRPDLSGLPGPQTIPGVGTIDVRAAVAALVPTALNVDLLDVRAVRAQVTGRCVGGAPRLTGTHSVAALTVLGRRLPIDRVVSQAATIADTSSIDPSDLSPAQLGLPGIVVKPKVLQDLLDALPTISIPATVARIRVTPGGRTQGGGQLTQRALDVDVTLGGRNLLDLTIGRATVGSAAVNCGGVSDLALQCTTRRIVLIDVLARKGKVRLLGAADRRFAGRRVRIRFTASGKTVARPTLGADGIFRARAKLPRRSIRRTSRARYVATIGGERSLRLKLTRRMVVARTVAANGQVTIAGRIVRPLAKPVREVVVQRRVACGSYEVVLAFKPRRSGRFEVTLPGPGSGSAAVYRMRTRVRRLPHKPRLFPTFTLPRYVDLA